MCPKKKRAFSNFMSYVKRNEKNGPKNLYYLTMPALDSPTLHQPLKTLKQWRILKENCRITIREIAEHVGISVSCVWYGNNAPTHMSFLITGLVGSDFLSPSKLKTYLCAGHKCVMSKEDYFQLDKQTFSEKNKTHISWC